MATSNYNLSVTRDARSRKRILGIAFWAIPGIIALWLFWLAITYRGLIALAAEWQFNAIGRYYPTMTYLVLASIVFSPVVAALWWRRRRARRAAETAGNEGLAATVAEGATGVILLSIAGALGLVALLSLIMMLTLPGGRQDKADILIVGAPGSSSPPTGATALRGYVLFDRVAAFDEDLWLVRRSVRFAPVFAAGQRDRVVRYFVELPPSERNEAIPSLATRRGTLKQGGLPGEVIRLYRYAGFRIEQPYYVLFASRESMRWPYLVVAAQAALAGLLFFAGGWLLRYRTRKRRDEVAQAVD